MGENSHEVTWALKDKLRSLEPILPANVQIKPVYDRTQLVDYVIDTVRRSLFEGGLLVIAVLFIFLGNVRAALIVAVAIPLSMMFAFMGMYRFGIAASLLSLGAIDFGMVGRLSRQHRERLVDVLFSLMSEDLENVARIWFSIGKPGTTVDYGAFEAEVIDVLERHIVGRELDEWDLAAFFRDLAAGAVKHGIRLPSDFTMMFKAMVTTEGLARTVAAGTPAPPVISATRAETSSWS
jgi:hypothetical protein